MDKMYVLVRSDLTKIQQAVQSGHALAEYLLNHNTTWRNGTLVYLGVTDEAELLHWGRKLSYKGIGWKGFNEPDINNELTALATVSDGKVFRKLRLL